MKSKSKRTTIRMRILRLSLISVGVAILVLSGILAMQLDYVSTTAYKSEIQSLAVTYTSSVKAASSTVCMQIEAAANNEILNSETSRTVLKAELAKLAETTSFKDFSISDASGKTLNDTDISDREYFQDARAGKTAISRPVIRKTDGSTVIMVATPMPNGNILYGALNQDTLSTGLTDEFLGKGFAVVATEVGNLAQKSAESAQSTRDLITSTFEAVKVGSSIAKETATSLKEVTELSEKSANLVQSIAEEASAQATALTQATQGIADISEVIQQNSATAEESAASCEELSAQAQILAEQASHLKV